MRLDEHVHAGYRGEPVLSVPVDQESSTYPVREGWVPFFVGVNLKGWGPNGTIKMIVSYKKASV